MNEANATVDPFDSAGVQTPTQGIGQDCGVNNGGFVPYAVPASLGALLTRSDVDLDPIQVVVPFVADGDILMIDFSVPLASDPGSPPTQATFGPVLSWVSEAGPTLALVFLEGLASTSYDPAAGSELKSCIGMGWWTVIGDSTGSSGAYPVNGGPVTVNLAYVLDGDAFTGSLLGVPTLRVQRVPRQRLYGPPPPANFIPI